MRSGSSFYSSPTACASISGLDVQLCELVSAELQVSASDALAFFVTSVRGMVLPPQMAAKASLSFFGAKMPTPFFFMASAIFLPLAFFA